MKKSVPQINWQGDIKEQLGIDIQMIDSDFALLDKANMLPAFHFPFKLDVTTIMICTKGLTIGTIGLKRYKMPAPCIVTLLAGEIIQNEYVSPDFEGRFIVMSKRLTDTLKPDTQNRVPVTLSIREKPYIPLNKKELSLLKNYFSVLKNTVEMLETHRCTEVVRLFMKAFYLVLNSHLNNPSPDKENNFVKQFLELVEIHYKTERQVGFYAEKLHLTPKYLSRLIKQQTRKSANDWIDNYVMLEAKALLKSTGMSIRQISEELNFADQSVFGRYFKKIERLSPKEYRRK
jgi:AraC-like DNA-binding protein